MKEREREREESKQNKADETYLCSGEVGECLAGEREAVRVIPGGIKQRGRATRRRNMD